MDEKEKIGLINNLKLSEGLSNYSLALLFDFISYKIITKLFLYRILSGFSKRPFFQGQHHMFSEKYPVIYRPMS